LTTTVSTELIEAMERQKYHFVGNHSAVKKCRWLHETLVHNRPCYKQKFYGINTHQCIQMTPAAFYCTQQCLFCWRAQTTDLKTRWDETKLPDVWDEPEHIIEGSIKAQHQILTGYKANPKADKQKVKEARTPRHAAISLTGEPTLYKHIGTLIQAFHKKGFTTFLVTNGTQPQTLSNLEQEPTQLYISLCAPDEQTYKRVCRPQTPNAWEKINQTLTFLPSFKCPTVIRMTLADKLNMKNTQAYAKLIQKAEPTYIEAKAYMHIGYSRLRLTYENMPSHTKIEQFAQQLAKQTNYNFIDESAESRVALLSKLPKSKRLDSNQDFIK
jgi:tRNA wybutosine-synthesizing protein 1